MTNDIINNELEISWPEGFHRMNEAELRKAFKDNNPNRWGIMDEERHMMITVGWKRLGSLTALMVNAGDVARHTEKTIHRAMAQMGYHCEGFRERQIAGAGAAGFRYKYNAQNTDMVAESLVVKLNKTVYYFHVYARAAVKEESLSCWEDILDAAERIKE